MIEKMNLLDRIKNTYSLLRPSEQKVADYVLENIEACSKMTILELSEAVKVSQPTIIRFVQALGIDGYRNFKYCLLREGVAEKQNHFKHLSNFDLKPWETLESLPFKEITVAHELLDNVLKNISKDELSRAVRILSTARIIDIYGVENSFTPANDLLTKLTYLGLNCKMHTDAYLQQISACHLTVADAVVAFSHSGSSIDTIKAVKQAKKSGANTIVVSSVKEPMIAKYADIFLCIGGENNFIYGSAIFSRVPDIAMVDLLYMGIILSDFERFSKNLDKSGCVISDRGY